MAFAAAWPLVLDFFSPTSMAQPTMASGVDEHDWNLAQMLVAHKGDLVATSPYRLYMASMRSMHTQMREFLWRVHEVPPARGTFWKFLKDNTAVHCIFHEFVLMGRELKVSLTMVPSQDRLLMPLSVVESWFPLQQRETYARFRCNTSHHHSCLRDQQVTLSLRVCRGSVISGRVLLPLLPEAFRDMHICFFTNRISGYVALTRDELTLDTTALLTDSEDEF